MQNIQQIHFLYYSTIHLYKKRIFIIFFLESKDFLILSSLTKIMDKLYPLIQLAINQGSQSTLNEIITFLNQNPGDISKQYEVGTNILYILRRLISASLARDNKIKLNSVNGLRVFTQQAKDLLNQINKQAFVILYLSLTSLKQCSTKQEKNAYITGKMNVTKILISLFKGNKQIISEFVELFNAENQGANQHNQLIQKQQIMQVLYLLAQNQSKRQQIQGLLKISQSNEGTLFLSRLLFSSQAPAQKPKSKKAANLLNQSVFPKLVQESIKHYYPKQSVSIKYFGLNLVKLIQKQTPQSWFKKQYSIYLLSNQDLQTQDGDFKKLYYLLQVQKYFLQNNQINSKNISQNLCVQMFIIWLQQLRVKNKHMRQISNQIKIHFDVENNPQFALQVIKYLHTQKKIYLQNISSNHPLSQLYINADANNLWQYFINLVQNQNKKQKKQDMQEQQQQRNRQQQYLSQLQYVTRQKNQNLTTQQISKTLIILIKQYQQSKGKQKLLNLIWSLFHHVTDSLVDQSKTKLTKQKTIIKNKKKLILNKKGPQILGKLTLNQLEMETQIQQILTKTIKFLKIKVKNYKQTDNKIFIAFLNFVTALSIYSIVYPQQSDVCAEIQFIFKDLQTFLNKEQNGNQGKDTLKKKVKKNPQQQEDPKKPIHVLIDVFISMLTKAPVFLRNAINLLFQQIVPYLQVSDLDTLLDVIMKPDQQYIQEI